MKRIDLTGQRFGRLLVVGKLPHRPHDTFWKCLCDCGEIRTVTTSHLIHGDTKSCGCLNKDMKKTQFRTHGATANSKRTREYRAWLAMHDRCYLSSCNEYKNYGARGITICERWNHSFENFLKDMGFCPKGCTIDRKDNDKGYSPENCRWATYKQQNNNRRDNVLVAHEGKSLTISQWSDLTGIPISTIRQRLTKLGWPVEKALFSPINSKRLLTFRGETRTATEWASLLGIKPATIFTRLNKGWPVEKALTEPPRRIL